MILLVSMSLLSNYLEYEVCGLPVVRRGAWVANIDSTVTIVLMVVRGSRFSVAPTTSDR